MISRWLICNFKSFKKAQDIEFREINFLAGANSGGKSSIIQSILLISQSFTNQFDNSSIQLNGIYTQLGSMEDIANPYSENDMTYIDFNIDITKGAARNYSFYKFRNKSIGVQLFFKGSGVETNPSVEKMVLKVKDVNNGIEESNYTIQRRDIDVESYIEKTGIQNFSTIPWLTEALAYEVSDNFYSTSSIHDRVLGVIFRGIKPSRLVVRVNLTAVLYDSFLRMSDYNNDPLLEKEINWPNVEKITLGYKTIRGIYKVLDLETSKLLFKKRIVDKMKSQNDTAEIQLSTLLQRYLDLKNEYKLKVAEDLKINLPHIELLIKDTYANTLYAIETEEIPDEIEGIINLTTEYFSKQIVYLGPLREQPRVVYPRSSVKHNRDIGNSGENTAMIIAINSEKRIRTVVPRGDGKFSREILLFREAMGMWLKYLEIADEISVSTERQLGYRIKVTRDGINSDLTHVGVGVSQILPILTACLLAEPGNTLIFEQPELHLHPKVQSRLTDLFTQLSKISIQFIIETHSEYIINRVRLGIVENSIRPEVKVYFLSNNQGSSQINEVEFNDFGVISNWPKDFMDQTENDLSALAQAKIKKIKEKRN